MGESVDIKVRPACLREDALGVLKRLRKMGHVAYFAGGCVRDLLLGLEPKDYDVATDAPPGRVRDIFPHTQAVGAAFGVILVHYRRSVVEVATFRREGNYLDGRRPSEVHFTTAEEDAKRRDFTINGLFLDPIDGRVIDYVGGQEDLALRRLRAIGEPAHRFEEDHLRLLRAVRFAARFSLGIEEKTAEAIATHAVQLRRISPERIADELRLMLSPTTRTAAWEMLWRFGLIHEVYRFLPADIGAKLDPQRSVFLALRPGEGVDFALALAAGTVCYRLQTTRTIGLDKPAIQKAVRAIRQALKISNDDMQAMEGILYDAALLLSTRDAPVAMLKRFLARPTAGRTRELLRTISSVGIESPFIASLESSLVELAKTEYAPLPLLTGDDLTAMGFVPGPIFKRILDGVYDAQLEGRIAGREEAVALARLLAAQ